MTSHYDGVLRKLSAVLALRDAGGRPLSYSHSHRLRHTKATTLLNAGAPVHVVQRYLGHRSPEMSMRYAATLATTAEREFLAMAKIGRDGRELGMERRDMLDLLQLDRRTDRVLPNGYCLLPRSDPATRATPATDATTSPPTAATFPRSAASSPQPNSSSNTAKPSTWPATESR